MQKRDIRYGNCVRPSNTLTHCRSWSIIYITRPTWHRISFPQRPPTQDATRRPNSLCESRSRVEFSSRHAKQTIKKERPDLTKEHCKISLTLTLTLTDWFSCYHGVGPMIAWEPVCQVVSEPVTSARDHRRRLRFEIPRQSSNEL